MDKCYLISMNDPVLLRKSSSGGLGAAVAEYMVKKPGVVYGVSYTADFKRAEFVRATTEQEIDKLLGSKYIYADDGALFGGYCNR